ncbi:MAG: hypothetical protein PHI63_03575 [Patescibacteria group bacterium]|nr:hypothetical protein [Patescibacteria group bacterium]
MKRLSQRAKLFLGVAGTLALFAPTFVLAIGMMTEPIVVKNARRGQVINETLTIYNTEKLALKLQLKATGAIAEWVKYYLPSDMKTAVTEVEMTATSNREVVAVITVGGDAKNGTYEGELVVEQGPQGSSTGESGAVVSQQVTRPVSISVTDKEEFKAEVSVIPQAYDIKPDAPLSIRVQFQNQGNVQITPKLQVKIRKAEIDSQALSDVTLGYPAGQPAVKPLESGEATYTVPTNGLVEGKYIAEVTALEGEQVLAQQDFTFSIDKNAKDLSALATATGTPGLLVGNTGIVIAVVVVGIVAIAVFAFRKKKA